MQFQSEETSTESDDSLDIITIDEGARSDDSFAMNEKRVLADREKLYRSSSADKAAGGL